MRRAHHHIVCFFGYAIMRDIYLVISSLELLLFIGQHPVYGISDCMLLARYRFQEESVCRWIRGNYTRT
jgi:hypothetical protein